MRFLRTANAGGLITLDGVRIVMDGVCGLVAPYLETPTELREYLQEKVPDAVGFTHQHPDHFHSGYCDYCKKTDAVLLMPGADTVKVGEVCIRSFDTRHLGKVESGLIHNSFLISGSQSILFAGDAAPSAVQSITNVDIMVAPYAYVTTSAGRKAVSAIGAKHLILVHLPEANCDPFGLWENVKEGISQCNAFSVIIPEMGEEIVIY